MDRLILPLLGALVLVAAGAGGVWWWDRHPDPLGFHMKLLFWRPGFDLPTSLLTRAVRAEALAASRKGELDGLAAAGQGMTQAAQAGLRAAQPAVRAHEAIARELRDYEPRGEDVCAQWEDADAKVLGALR
jgi:hypothetical protein